MQNVLLGGLITLAVTALVQILIIPTVQRRTRARERWEDNVTELVTAVNEEWLDKAMALDTALGLQRAMRIRVAEAIASDPTLKDAYRAPLSEADTDAEEAYAAAQDLTSRMILLLRRCTLLSPQAPYWPRVFDEAFALIRDLRELSPRRDSLLSSEEVRRLVIQLNASHGRLSAVLEEISRPIKPPPAYTVRRFRQRVRGALTQRSPRP